MEWLNQIAQACLILGFAGGAFKYFVINPLTKSISALAESVSELRAELKRNNERINNLEGAIERIENAVVTAHARIDKILHEKGSDNRAEKLGYR